MFVRELFEEFLPKDKNVLLFDTTDGAVNIFKLSRLLGHERVTCVAHSLHNLLIKDTLTKIPEVQALISQCKDIVGALNFKAHLIDEFVLEQKEADTYAKIRNLASFLEDFQKFTQIISQSKPECNTTNQGSNQENLCSGSQRSTSNEEDQRWKREEHGQTNPHYRSG